MRTENGTFSSPFFIFIKGVFDLSDIELCAKLGLENYELVTDKAYDSMDHLEKRHLFLTEDEQWTHLMDDWFYTLWYDQEIRERIRVLSFDFDIFCCSVGDIDVSYDFRYYQKGKVVREYVVEDPNFKGPKVVINTGTPLNGEASPWNRGEPETRVLHIASSLGINVKHDLSKIRCYSREELVSEQFTFNEDEY